LFAADCVLSFNQTVAF